MGIPGIVHGTMKMILNMRTLSNFSDLEYVVASQQRIQSIDSDYSLFYTELFGRTFEDLNLNVIGKFTFEPPTETLTSKLRNKLTPFFNLVALIKDGTQPELVKRQVELCNTQEIRQMVGEIELELFTEVPYWMKCGRDCQGQCNHPSNCEEDEVKMDKDVRIADLTEALTKANEHLEWIGYGDNYERDCARESKLDVLIFNALNPEKQELSATLDKPVEDPTFGQKMRGAKMRAKWLAYCLEIGWSKDSLDRLGDIWDANHDEAGNLIRIAEVKVDAASLSSANAINAKTINELRNDLLDFCLVIIESPLAETDWFKKMNGKYGKR